MSETSWWPNASWMRSRYGSWPAPPPKAGRAANPLALLVGLGELGAGREPGLDHAVAAAWRRTAGPALALARPAGLRIFGGPGALLGSRPLPGPARGLHVLLRRLLAGVGLAPDPELEPPFLAAFAHTR
jgi:hypothetical protein